MASCYLCGNDWGGDENALEDLNGYDVCREGYFCPMWKEISQILQADVEDYIDQSDEARAQADFWDQVQDRIDRDVSQCQARKRRAFIRRNPPENPCTNG